MIDDSPVAYTSDLAWVEADQLGRVRAINQRFTEDFGWSADSIVGQPLLILMPEGYRDAHNIGFARFIEFEKSSILGQPVRLPVMTADGETVMTEAIIQADRRGRDWRFAAQFVPIDGAET